MKFVKNFISLKINKTNKEIKNLCNKHKNKI